MADIVFDDVMEVRFAMRDDTDYNEPRFQTVTVGKSYQGLPVHDITVVLPDNRSPLIKLNMGDISYRFPDVEVSYFTQV